MLIGYVCVAESGDHQTLDFHINELLKSGVDKNNIYYDFASGKKDRRPGLTSCVRNLRKGDTLVIWKLEFMGPDLSHVLQTIHDLLERGVSLKTLSGNSIYVETNTTTGQVVSGMCADLTDIRKTSGSAMTSTSPEEFRRFSRRKGPKFSLSEKQIRQIQSALSSQDTNVSALCNEFKITRQTLYRYFAPNGALRPYGEYVLLRQAKKEDG